jgi:Fe-S cluster assembly protein SufD
VKKSFSDAPEAPTAELPDWYQAARSEAWVEFGTLSMPKRTDEEWRFADLRKLQFDHYVDGGEIGSEVAADLLTRSVALEENAGRIIFANERLIADPLLDEEFAAQGVIFKPLSQALVDHEDLVSAAFMREEAKLGGKKFAALHRARLRDGFFLHVPKDVSIDRPLEVFHWLSGEDAAIFPHSLIVTGQGAKVAIAEYVASADDVDGFCCGVADLVAGENSSLTYVRTQNLSEKARSIQINSTVAGAGADAKSFAYNVGCAWSRGEHISRMIGAGANSDMLAVCIPEDSQEMDMRTFQAHESPHTTSNLLYKNALYDKSRTIFAGLIKVDEGAHQTDAYQTCRNLMMSDEVEANSMPGLEINADQVKCSHGSTSGPITDEELFYLRARGIEERAARQLVTFGFVKEAVDGIGNEALEKVVVEKMDRRFAKVSL